MIDITAFRFNSMNIYNVFSIDVHDKHRKRLAVAIKLAMNAMKKKIRPSPKMRLTSFDRSDLFAGQASFQAVRTSTVKSKHIE